MTERSVKIESRVGLHARRPRCSSRPRPRPDGRDGGKRGGDPVNAKSILAVLGLDARHGEEVVLSADGDGAEALLDDLEGLLSTPEPEGA